MAHALITSLNQDKVIKEAALRSGGSKGIMQACWDPAGQVIKAWDTEGHSVALPGLGTMRFGLRVKPVATAEEVKAGLISTRRISHVQLAPQHAGKIFDLQGRPRGTLCAHTIDILAVGVEIG